MTGQSSPITGLYLKLGACTTVNSIFIFSIFYFFAGEDRASPFFDANSFKTFRHFKFVWSQKHGSGYVPAQKYSRIETKSRRWARNPTRLSLDSSRIDSFLNSIAWSHGRRQWGWQRPPKDPKGNSKSIKETSPPPPSPWTPMQISFFLFSHNVNVVCKFSVSIPKCEPTSVV